ncbi:Lrp/AsnC family transcriptional regulator [Thalassotalea sp. M1531]|uniref:siroheme decarboxylase n=1 Tax=Thalassotalea algicola TaxID=2716224 RepID=A0A7Y0LCS4_9GAMM|nr:Lrp/AsnC family transcriptional regulator [Thalassotalea algicola]
MHLPELAKKLINQYQKQFPLTSQPYLAMAEQFDCSEQEVMDCLALLSEQDVISRIGPVFDHKKAGASTLAALAVPEDKIDEIAEIVNQFEQVNHNYAREHSYNLWFVVTAANQPLLDQAISAIEDASGYPVLVLPMEAAYHIDLSFDINFEQPRKALN